MSYFGSAISDFFATLWNFVREFFTLLGGLLDSVEDLVGALSDLDTSITTLATDMQSGNFHGVRILEVMSTIKYLAGDWIFNLLYALILISFFMILVPFIWRFIKFVKGINFQAFFGDTLENLKGLLP
ncbi:MAG: hypothetical protein K6C97_12615 [Treponema sp.]|nr:hypothetical protein [Treponema sp.]